MIGGVSNDTALPNLDPKEFRALAATDAGSVPPRSVKVESEMRKQRKLRKRAVQELARRALLPSDTRSAVNETLPPGYACAVNRPPGKPPQLVIVRLPRSSSGKPPRRGVHIPLPPHAYARIEAKRLADNIPGRQLIAPAPSKVEQIITAGKRLLEVARAAGGGLFKRLVRKVAAKLS